MWSEGRWDGRAGRRYWSLYKHLDGYFTWILNYIPGRHQTAKPPARARPSPQFVRTKNKYSSLRIQRITAAGCHWWRAQLVLNLISVPRSHWPRARTFTLVLGTVMHGQGGYTDYTGLHRTLDTRGRGGDNTTDVNTYLEKEKNSVLLCTFCRFWIAKTLVGTLNKDKVLVGAFSGHCPVDSSRQILVTILVWQYWWQCYSMQWQCDCDHVKLRSDVTTARNVATSARWQHARTVTSHTYLPVH